MFRLHRGVRGLSFWIFISICIDTTLTFEQNLLSKENKALEVSLLLTRQEGTIAEQIETENHSSNIEHITFGARTLIEAKPVEDKEGAIDKILQVFSLVFLLIGNFLQPKDLSFAFAISGFKAMEHLRYINAPLSNETPQNLELFVRPFSVTYALGFQIPQGLKDGFSQAPLPPAFTGLHSQYLANQWQLLMSFSLIIGVTITIYLAGILSKVSGNVMIKAIINRLQLVTGWGLFFLALFCSYDDITLFSIIEFRTLNFDSNLSFWSFAICILMIILALYFLITIMIIFEKASQGESTQQISIRFLSFVGKIEFEMICSGYRNNSWFQQSFFFWFIIRTIISNIIIGCLEDYPLLQVIWMICLSLGMLFYLLSEKPIKQKLPFGLSLINEILILLINLLLILVIMFNNEFDQGISFTIFIIKTAAYIYSHASTLIYAALNFYKILQKAKSRAKEGQKIACEAFYKAIFEETEDSKSNFTFKQNAKLRAKIKNKSKLLIYQRHSSDSTTLLTPESITGAAQEEIHNQNKGILIKIMTESPPESSNRFDEKISNESLNSALKRSTDEVILEKNKKSSMKSVFGSFRIQTPSTDKVASIIIEEPSLEEATMTINPSLVFESQKKVSSVKNIKSLIFKEKMHQLYRVRKFKKSSLESLNKNWNSNNCFESETAIVSTRIVEDVTSKETINNLPSEAQQPTGVPDRRSQRSLSEKLQAKRRKQC